MVSVASIETSIGTGGSVMLRLLGFFRPNIALLPETTYEIKIEAWDSDYMSIMAISNTHCEFSKGNISRTFAWKSRRRHLESLVQSAVA